jgi:hypothetical protein
MGEIMRGGNSNKLRTDGSVLGDHSGDDGTLGVWVTGAGLVTDDVMAAGDGVVDDVDGMNCGYLVLNPGYIGIGTSPGTA